MPVVIPTTPSASRLRNNDHHTVVKVNCGCGARFDNVSDGEAHAMATGHTLHIAGEIRPLR
jgi:hypothetical protein